MAQAPTTTLLQIWQDVNDEIGSWYAADSTSSGSTSTIVDSALTSSLRHSTSFKYRTARINESGHGADGEERRVSSFTSASGTLTAEAVYSASIGSGVGYYLASIPPSVITTAVQTMLREFEYLEFECLSEVANAGGELYTSTTPDNWTAVNSTVATETGVENVWRGRRSIKVTDSGSGGGYARSARINVHPGNTVHVECVARGDAGAQVDLTLYDVTNSAEIVSTTHSEERFQLLWADVSIPSGCKQVDVYLKMNGSSGVAYFDEVAFWDHNRRSFNAPDWVLKADDVVALRRRVGDQVDEDRDKTLFYNWGVGQSSGDGRGIRLVHNWGSAVQLSVGAYRSHPTVSAATDTVRCGRDAAKWLTIATLLRERSFSASRGRRSALRIDRDEARAQAEKFAPSRERRALRPVNATLAA